VHKSLTHLIGRIVPYYVNLTNQNCATNHHRHGNDGYILSREIKSSDMDMLASKNISPQKTSQRCTECCTESSVVDAQGHGVYGCPECAVADGYAVVDVDLLPSLDDSGKENGRADVCACEL
jgi:hypothetical protein